MTDCVTKWHPFIVYMSRFSTTSCGLCKKTSLDQCFWKCKNNSFIETTKKSALQERLLHLFVLVAICYSSFYSIFLHVVNFSLLNKLQNLPFVRKQLMSKMANVFLVQFLLVYNNYRVIGAKWKR